MNDRDLTVAILALMVGLLVGAIDTLVHFNDEVTDGALSAILISSTAWTFYRLRS